MLEYKSISTVSGSTGFVEFGEGKPLILIVGYSGTLFHWNKHFIYELAKSYKVYLIDNRKIGLSTSNNPESIEGFAKDVIDFIEAKNIEQPAILGWSLGGVVVQELLKFYEFKVSKAIFLATVPDMKYVNPEFFKLVRNVNQYSVTEFREKLYYFFFSDTMHGGIKDAIANNSLKINNYHYRFNDEARALQDAVIPDWIGISATELSAVQIPVLLLWAKDDLVVSEDAVKFLSTNLKTSQRITYDYGGHFLIQESPRKIAHDIIGYLNQD